jgi:hypothetical protein
VYIITAWDKVSETHVRAPDNATAVRHAREFVNQGKRISIVRTSDGVKRVHRAPRHSPQ